MSSSDGSDSLEAQFMNLVLEIIERGDDEIQGWLGVHNLLPDDAFITREREIETVEDVEAYDSYAYQVTKIKDRWLNKAFKLWADGAEDDDEDETDPIYNEDFRHETNRDERLP